MASAMSVNCPIIGSDNGLQPVYHQAIMNLFEPVIAF